MTGEIFDVHEGHLVSLAASVAAGCLPCAGYYIDRAREAGVGNERLRGAIAIAEAVRRQALDDLARRVRSRIGETAEGPELAGAPADEMALLLSLTAAYAVNSHALVAALLNAARARQVPHDKVVEAVQIARGVRNMAVAIVDRCIEREGGPGAGQDEPVSCVCR